MKIDIKIIHIDINSQCQIFLLVSFFCASCKFIISNFSAISFRESSFCSVTFSPSNVLTGVSKASDNETNNSESGTDKPCSHF